MQRGLAAAALEFGYDDLGVFVDWLLSGSLTTTQLQMLASHLTIGETYFYREKKTFEALTNTILPELIRSRRGREQRLRLWSAACCSGEEAYSLAILLHQVLPDLADWRVSILGTDINAHHLRKAVAGVYSEWSFRDAPPGFKERYFTCQKGRYTILPEIKQHVTFEHLNLVEDVYPSLATNTNAMDLIFCRNVLMYFTPAQMHKTIARLHNTLLDGGCLAVSPSESSQQLFPQFATLNFPGAILYRKSAESSRKTTDLSSSNAEKKAYQQADCAYFSIELPKIGTPIAPVIAPISTEVSLNYEKAILQYENGHYEAASDALLPACTESAPDSTALSLLARALANQGKLMDALACCDRWLAADKMNAAGHYLRAIILLEQGGSEQARLALQRAIYLQPEFVLAHFALGNLARSQRKYGEAKKHFNNARNMCMRCDPNELLPESDGLTVARLTETIATLTERE